jgi:DNA-binding NtrC family response regulator
MLKGRILIADDEPIISQTLQKVFSASQFEVYECNSGERLITAVEESQPHIVFLDIYFGNYNGIELLKKLKAEGWKVPVVIMTAFADVSIAVQAMKEGATDFITKPFDLHYLNLVVQKIMDYNNLNTKVKVLQAELTSQQVTHGIIGNSSIIRQLLQSSERLAASDSTTVLLQGESGTGKELFARYIHQKSIRNEKPFVTINCGAIPKDLAESELFGYEKGAFTGAGEKMKQGKFELADGGTILLDEIGELSLDLQVKLLRVLEEKKFYRLGGTREIKVDVRVLAATNRNLRQEVEEGRFRDDLYYRLNVAIMHIPPLRERPEDIIHLATMFLQEFARKFTKETPVLTEGTVEHLKRLPWKGNVRELKNAIERVMLLNDVSVLREDHFKFLMPPGEDIASLSAGDPNVFTLQIPSSGITMKEVLRELILKTLALTNGNQVRAAKILEITRSKLRYRMEQLNIQAEQRSYKIQETDR